jgi:hypothetical protein
MQFIISINLIMKKTSICLVVILMILQFSNPLSAQKKVPGEITITSSDLESYLSFLASPLLKGRKDGDESLDIAAQYIASQARLLGLKPANDNSYFQPYYITKKSIVAEKTNIKVYSSKQDTVTINDPFYSIMPMGPADMTIEGDIVFAGYGIKSTKYHYNDLDSIQIEGKIVLVMDRAPMKEDGKTCQFDDPNWLTMMSFQMKLQYLMFSKAKAILFVPDPKSGFQSIADGTPGLADYLSSSITLKSEKPSGNTPPLPTTKIIFINRSVADAILNGSGRTLAELQNSIDASLKPHSFLVANKQLRLKETSIKEDKVLNNVAGYIEGRDPVLKSEVLIFSGHYDHVGVSGNKVNPGADDDASGCAALLSMAKAFQSLSKKPLRTILFLWVSGEEVGLFGSQKYVNSPLFPLDKTVADLNMDMIGRTKSVADTGASHPMTGPNSIFVITDNQSKELNNIANEIDKKSPLDFDYSLSGRKHPLQLFARSDHYNFVKKDIPILFFSSGLHTDYHTPGDVIEKIDFKKMELVTRTMYEIGLTVANMKSRPVVDNPYSKW